MSSAPAASARFDLFELMRFDAMDGIVELERHIARLGASAATFGFAFNRHDVRNELHAASFRLRDDAGIRLRLSPTGTVAIETHALPPPPATPVAIRIVPLPVDPADPRLAHKRSDGAFRDQARAAAGTFEVVFRRRDGRLTDGSFTTLFAVRDDLLVTPPLADGVMPGVLRACLLDTGEAIEGSLTEDDLVNGCFIGNAERGLLEARVEG